MSAKDERNLNITINNNDDAPESEIVISLSTVIRKFKKYFMIWVIAAIIAGVVAGIYAIVTTHTKKPELSSIISFSYNGIEKGLDPKGRKFHVDSIKNPAVIEDALTELGMNMNRLEDIRNGISFSSIRPQNIQDKYTIYTSILDQGGSASLSAGEKLLETAYYPTRFTVWFDYNNTGLSDEEAVDVFNTILEKYEDYFYVTYGYNESLGNAVISIDYSEYDYAEALDVFDNSLHTLKSYVSKLANEDDTRFRSEDTGYTFDDLYSTINTIESVNLDKISSYISFYTVTKDKDTSLAYYEYRIKAMTRQKDSLEEQLEAIELSIDAYEKDQMIVFGGMDEANVQSSVTSAEYDKMFSKKNSLAADLANTKQRINYYKERQQALKNNERCSPEMLEKVDKELADLDVKVKDLVDLVSRTADDYYRNVTFGHAYTILVPATNSSSDKLRHIIGNMKLPLVLLEALCIMIYFGGALLEAVITDSKKRKLMLAVAADNAAVGGGDDDDDKDDNKTEDKTEEKEEKSSDKKKK